MKTKSACFAKILSQIKSTPRTGRPAGGRQLHRLTAMIGMAMMMFATAALSAKTLTWQSTSSTAWETAGNWFDEVAVATSTTAPAAADNVTINSSRGATAQPSITVTAQACKTLVVGNGYTLTLSGAAASPMLTVGDTLTGNNDITIQNGGQIINASTAASGNPFTLANTSNDKFRIDSGGTYVHNTARSYTTPFPNTQQDFDANSTFIWRGSSTIAPSVVFSSRTFGNVVIESTSGNCIPAANTGTGTATVNGGFSVGATGAGTVNYVISSATVTSPWIIAGNLSVGSGSTNIFIAMPVTLSGNLTNNGVMTYGTNFTFNGSATIVAGSSAPTFTNNLIINSGKSVTLLQNVTVSGGTATNNGTLNCGTSIISGAGNFTNVSGATLGIGSASGITSSGASGNIQVSGTRGFSPGASYTYNGAAAQATGSGLPSSVNNLTINNSLAVASGGVTLTANITVTNQLGLTAGRLITGGNQAIVADTGSISGGGSGSYVDGNLQKVWASTGTKSFTFPVGTGATFAPCSVTNLVLTASGNLTASTTNSEHANIGSSTIDPTKDANRNWTMTTGGGLAVSTYNATCTFLGGDLDGGANSANFVMEKWNGSSWTRAASSSVAGNTVTGNGFTSLSAFAVGEPAAVSTDPAGVGAASPATVGRGNPVLLTVTVTPGTFPTSTGLAVSANLSAIGGSASQQFYDDNTHGDVTAGDNIFSYSNIVTTGTSIGPKSLSTVITDAQLRTNSSAIISVTVAGTTRIWSGGGADDNWSTGINWSGGVSPISPEDSVTFAGSTRLTPALDSSATVPSLVFDSTAGSFTLGASGGSTLTLNGGTGLTNNSANAETVNIPLIMGSAQTFNATGAGLLTIANTVNNGGNLLTSDGANNSSFTGAISGGGGVNKVGNGTMTLAGGNLYGGATTVSAGTLGVSGGAGIPDTSAVTVSNVAGATLSVNANETVGSLAGGGATGGTVALGANNLTFGGTTIYSGAVTGTGKLIKAGAGTLTLNNAGPIGSSFTTRIEGGTVDLNRGGSALGGIIGSGNIIELAGGILQLSGSVQANFGVTNNALNVSADSTISFNRTGTSSPTSPTITTPLNFTGNANLSFAYNVQITSGTTAFNGASNTLQGNATLTLGASGYNVTIANPIGEFGGSYSLTKAGAGTLNLSAVNTYSGNTTNMAGIIAINATSTFGNGSGTLVLAGGDILNTSTRAGAPILNPVIFTGGTSTLYGDSGVTTTRILPFSSTFDGSAGTLRIGNKGVAANLFEVRLTGGGISFARPIIVGDGSFDTAGALSQLQFYNTNTTADQIFTGDISGTGTLLRDTPASGMGGTTVLSGSNTFAGGTFIAGGFIGLGSSSTTSGGVVTSGPVGTGILEIDNDPNVGLFAYGAARTVANQVFFNGVSNIQFNGNNDLTLAGLVRVGGVAKTLTINNTGVTTISGVLSNAAPLFKAGSGTLVLSGTNVNTGGFTVGAGTLALSGNGSISNSPTVSIAGGATFDVSGLNSTFVLGSSQTFSNNSSSTGTLNGNLNTSSGTVSVSYTNGTPALNVTNGALTLSATTVFKIDNTGPTLPAGSYKIISKSATSNAGSVGGVLPSSVTVGGAGAAASVRLKIISGELYLVVNHSPIAGGNSYTRNGLNTWRISVADLLTNATDVDGDTLTLDNIATSTNGITLVIGGGYVQYYNTNIVDDQFTYTVTDGFGGTNSAVITLTAGSSNGVGGQINNFTANGGTASMSFAGIPGYLYHVQVSTNLSNWDTIWTTNAPSGGLFEFSDGSAPQPDAYYRLMWNGN